MIKKLALGVASMALMTNFALAQDNQQSTDPAATPPAATDAQQENAAGNAEPSKDAKNKTAEMKNEKAAGNTGGFVAKANANQMRVGALTGIAVQNASGESLGDINDVVIGVQGKPSFAVVGVGGFLGIGEKNVGVPFERIEFTMDEDNNRVARLDVSKETLESAPAYVYQDDQMMATDTEENQEPKTQ